MKKNVFKLGILIFIILLITNLPCKSNAVTTTYSSTGYSISAYDVNMVVQENNVFNITETITVNFTGANKHGIYRKIPLKNQIKRTDGTTSTNRVRITNISVNEEYQKSIENGNVVLKIGNADTTVTGIHKYVIKYNYNIGKDPVKDADELYFNIIGTEWDTSISNVTFNISMPKDFDSSSLGFSSGYYGSTDSSNIHYNVNGTLISGALSGTLSKSQGVSVRLTLPDGYFVNASNNFSTYIILGTIISVIFVGISLYIWYKYGKDDTAIETVEFHPPEGFNSAEIGYIYKGKVEDKDIVSLLIYLANKGYITIEEVEEQGLFATEKSFKIIKIKDYDGTNKIERRFLNGLFLGGERTEVSKSQLMNHFYTTIEDIKADLTSKENKNKYFEKASLIKSIPIIIMIIIEFLMINLVPAIQQDALNESFGLIFAFIIIIVIVLAVSKNKVSNILYILLVSLPIILPIFFNYINTIFADFSFVIVYIIGIISIILMTILLVLMPKRNAEGTNILGKIKGFRNFLQNAEKEQLEMQVEQNPTYFYDILPFAYVLGVSDKWIKQFESITITPPSWYYSDAFSVYNFGIFMNGMMYSATNVMSSQPAPQGGSSGGFGGRRILWRRIFWWRFRRWRRRLLVNKWIKY